MSGTGRMGVIAVACPTRDAGGQVAGLVLKVESTQAFCSVVRREGSCLGRSTFTERMFACVPWGALG